jgi:hypothetical protein
MVFLNYPESKEQTDCSLLCVDLNLIKQGAAVRFTAGYQALRRSLPGGVAPKEFFDGRSEIWRP